MVAVWILWDGDAEKLNMTVTSLQGAVPDPETNLRTTVFRCNQEKPETNMVLPGDGKAGVQDCEFLTILEAGEQYEPNALWLACRYFSDVKEQTDAVLLTNLTKKTKRQPSDQPEGTVISLDQAEMLQKLPACLHGMLLRTAAVQEHQSGLQQTPKDWDPLLLCRIVEQKGCIGWVKNAYFHGSTTSPLLGSFRKEWLDGQWYLKKAALCRRLLEEKRERYRAAAAENVPGSLFLESEILYELKICFMENKGSQNKGVLTGASLEQFLTDCRSCLRMIPNELITPKETVYPERRLIYLLWSALQRLKYCGLPGISGEQSAAADVRGKSGLQSTGGVPGKPGEQSAAAGVPGEEPLPYITLDLMECEQGVLRLDCSMDRFVPRQTELQVRRNDQPVPIERNRRFSGMRFFGEPLAQKDTFAVELPLAGLDADNRMEFFLVDGQQEQRLPITAFEYQSKLVKQLKQSYWCFDTYMATFLRGRAQEPVGIRFHRAGRMERLRRELALMKEILLAPYGSKQMFLMRSLYWLTCPFYAKKTIWMTFDKLYKGGDCGEYFYKYMESRKADGIVPYYIIQKTAPDCERLRREGYRPLFFRSWKQRLMYLHASMIFATHSSVHSFCGFSKWEVRFVQDRLKAVNTCIQHGLSVQDLTVDSNRIVNNNKRYYCASPCEVENLSKPAYDYGKEVLRLTGLARYDGLVNQDRKQILITPTWRAYIAMPAQMGSSRPYNPQFKNTDYFKIFQALLGDERLKRTAAQAGYEIVYLLHPVLSAQKEDFEVSGNVRLIPASEANYEQLLTESSLMVTDYSGVQFDFAYMRKPVVYFHPPKLPPHYEEGGFFYDTQGFGEICTETEELVDVLCGYLENGCALKEFYRKRQDGFFAYDDHENCRRIFEDALEYQREVQR